MTGMANKKKVVATIGRWMPIHNGHKAFFENCNLGQVQIIILNLFYSY